MPVDTQRVPASGQDAPPKAWRRAYPTDVSERQWRIVQPLLPSIPQATGRPRETDLREVLSALCYRWQTGCAWRMLPHDFPPWGTVYAYYRDWMQTGLIESLRERLARSR